MEILARSYHVTSDKKVGFEATKWSEGGITIILEWRSRSGCICRSHRYLTVRSVEKLGAVGVLKYIIDCINSMRPLIVGTL